MKTQKKETPQVVINNNITNETNGKNQSHWSIKSILDFCKENDKAFVKLIILLLIGLLGFYIYNTNDQSQQITRIEEKIIHSEEAEEENLLIRDEITPKVQKEIEKLLYQVDADRICLFEVHNGKANSTALPFRFADCTQESVNSDRMITYIGDQYQNIPLGHYKLPYIINDCKYISWTFKEVQKYDARFAQEMIKVNGKHLIASMLSNNGTHIGFLICFYDNSTNVPDAQQVRAKLEASSKIISTLLDLNVQRRIRFKEAQSKK